MTTRKPKTEAPSGYLVTAPMVSAQMGTQVLQFVAGDVLPDGVSAESVDHLKSLGFIADGDAPESDDK